MSIRLNRAAQVDQLIAALRLARKKGLASGGCRTVTAHDCTDPARRVFLEVDLTTEAGGRGR